MGKKAKEKELEIDLDLLEESIERAPFLPHDYIITESETRTMSETLSIIDFIEGFDEKVFLDAILEKIYHIEKLIDKVNELISKKFSQTKIETIGIDESKAIEEPDSTEIISEERNVEKLIETNSFLIKRNDELTKKIEVFTENYEKLVKENNENISLLENRIKELIESKVSISRTPSFWVEEAFSEEIERENV